MKLTVHILVKDEDQFIWYAISSVLPFADKILIYDTGSNDKTIEIIKKINSPKIIFEKRGVQDRKGLANLRREQIKKTKTEWFLILDGDEIWEERQIKKLIAETDNVPKNVVAVFNRTRDCIGDIYHYLPESAGRYRIKDQKGNLNIRMIRKTPTLKLAGEYPLEMYTDENGPLQNQDRNLEYVDCWYLHTTFLKRSSLDRSGTLSNIGKKKLPEKGLKLRVEEVPEVFNGSVPDIVPKPQRRGQVFELKSLFTTPLIAVKRKIR